jgi:hypothetical protein
VGWKPEARPQHRTQVKPCAGSSVRVSALPSVTPDIQSRTWGVVGPGAAGHRASLPWEISVGPRRGKSCRHGRDAVAPPGNQAANREHKLRPTAAQATLGSGRAEGGNDDRQKPTEKSDRPTVARKPGNAGGAKGAMG